jgi:hypothetical protein
MTPHEKAVHALNSRLERLQANLREARSETAQQFLFQSLVVTLGLSEAMTDYIKQVGEYSQRRHGEFKQASVAEGARHAELLKSGSALLEQLKASPTDRALRKEIERAQRNMEGITKELRRGAFALQRELALCMAMIDKLAENVRRLCEADQTAALKRVLKTLFGHVRELYAALESTRAAKDIINAPAWEKSATAEIDRATDFYDAYARAGHQAMLALDAMILAVSETPPQTAEETTHRANESAASRLKTIAARLTAT